MNISRETNEFISKIAKEIDVKNMMRDLQVFNQWERYSGSEAGEKAVDFIENRMKSLDIPVTREVYDIYRSLPLGGEAEVIGAASPKKYALTPYVYSGEAEKLTAEVVYDHQCEGKSCTQKEMRVRTAAFKGKIVLTRDNTYNFACAAKAAGALAILTIWTADLAHHGTLGGVWGSPTPDDLKFRYPYIPYAEIVKCDGEELKKLIEQSKVTLSLTIKMDNSIKKTSMPIAVIKGESDNFVLLSGHYDSWYEGITDNAVANVSMLETARVLKEHQKELKRTVVLAWWSGHSDGRYSGSTWYCDRYWKKIKDHCCAHVNMDICGCKTSDLVGFNTSTLEGTEFCHDFLKEFNLDEPIPPVPMARFADQTFWGAFVPLAIMPKYSRKVKPGERTFYWWHSKEDTIDKVDPEIMVRDSVVAAKLTGIFAQEERLPMDFCGFAAFMERELRGIEKGLNADFDLSELWTSLETLKKNLFCYAEVSAAQEYDEKTAVAIAGELTRLVYTSGSPYEQDPAVDGGTFAKLRAAVGQNPDNCEADYYLALKTQFYRQRNRLIGQFEYLAEKCEASVFRMEHA